MSQPDAMQVVPQDASGPVFAEPWQAQAFAMALALHERGLFTWSEWAAALAHEIASHGSAHGYYGHWLAALEELVIGKGLASRAALADLQAAWGRAAAATPHGQPVMLADGA